MDKCPNVNSRLYKDLSLQFSKKNVYNIWNNLTTERFDTWYGSRKRDSDGLPLINKYLEVYNDRLQKTSLLNIVSLESLSDVERLLSSNKIKGISKYKGSYYISKNNREHGLRILNSLNNKYPGLITTDSYWKNSQELGVVDRSEPIIKLKINDEVLSSQGRMFLSPKKEEASETENVTGYDFIINRLKEYSETIYNELRDESSKPKKEKNLGKIEQLKAKLAKVKSGIEELNKTRSLESIAEVANTSLEYVSNLLANKDNLTFEELNEIKYILSLYKNIDRIDSQRYKSAVLTKEDFIPQTVIDENGNEVEEILASVKEIEKVAKTASRLDDIYSQIVRQQITDIYNSRFDQNTTEQELFENIQDISWANKMFRDATSMGNKLLSLLSTVHTDASRIARQETLSKQKELQKVSDNLKLKSTARVEFMRKLWQTDDKGNPTGGLVNRYTAKYWKARNQYHEDMRSGNKKKIASAKAKHYNEHDYVNYFETEEEMKAEIDRLSKNYGIEYATQVVKDQAVLFEEYRDRRAEYFASIDAEEMSIADKKTAKEIWEIENNPDFTIKNLKDNTPTVRPGTNEYIYPSFEFVRSIPRKVTKDGKETGYYDSVYEDISQNPEQLAYYEYIKKELKTLLSYYPQAYLDAKGIHSGFIPMLKKDIADKYREDGLQNALKGFGDVAKSWYTTKVYSKSMDRIDPSTGQPISSLNIAMLSPEYTYTEDGKKIVDQNAVITDLDEILNQFIPVSTLYKHKARVESQHRAIVNAMKDVVGNDTTPSGNTKINVRSNEAYENSLKNLREAIEFVDDTFYEVAESKKEHASKLKKLSTKDKAEKQQIESKIEELTLELDNKETLTEEREEEIIKEIEKLNRNLDDLGLSYSYTKGIKSILRYFQLTSQGWNFGSATIELLYGRLSNIIHARGGREYNAKQLNTGFKIASLAVLPGSRASETSKKFKALIEKLDVVGDVAELEKRRINHSKSEWSAKRMASPYELMRNSDMISKGSVMVAMLLNTNLNGEQIKEGETSLWEAFDSDGKLKKEFKTSENEERWETSLESTNKLVKLAEKIAQVNKRNHGNYDPHSPILANTSAGGKALLQFRRWMLEGFATRFEDERYDEILGRDVKGKYRTYQSLFREFGGGKKGAIKTTAVMFKAMGHRLLFSSISDEQLLELGVESATDQENVRKNASGLISIISMYIAMLLIQSLVDDEDKEKFGALNFLINQGGRLQQDLWFYADPSTTADITKNFIPSIKLVDRVKDWGNNAIKTIGGFDPKYDPIYQKGDFKGTSKLLIKSGEMLPGTSSMIKTLRSMAKIYD